TYRAALSALTDKNEIAFPIRGRQPKICTVKEAFDHIKSGDNIFVHGMAATPTPLLKGFCEHVKANNLTGIKLQHLLLEGETPWIESDLKDRIRSNSLFTGGNLRRAVNEGVADFNSCFLHEIPMLFRRGAIKLNAAIIMGNAFGFCSLGPSVDITRAGAANAGYIIGQ
ncbi:hypothetical protein OSTOST_17621, partial [Ostertagia ostertagi]